mmetsp:Transcript_7919/g.9089  ORF Transcript_7919/g.9089 Transcript_7919/m.9089 type:complete len:134 (+) Transcript_7919:164-565(+)
MDKERDFEIPHSNVQRILKANLPAGVQLSKESKIAFAKSAGIFVMYLTAVANDFCKENRRQTLSASDVIDALKEIDFDEFVEPLEKCLAVQRAETQARKKAKTEKGSGRKEEKSPSSEVPMNNNMQADNDGKE